MPIRCLTFGHKFSMFTVAILSEGATEVCQRNLCRHMRTFFEHQYVPDTAAIKQFRKCNCGRRFYWPFQYDVKAAPECPVCKQERLYR